MTEDAAMPDQPQTGLYDGLAEAHDLIPIAAATPSCTRWPKPFGSCEPGLPPRAGPTCPPPCPATSSKPSGLPSSSLSRGSELFTFAHSRW